MCCSGNHISTYMYVGKVSWPSLQSAYTVLGVHIVETIVMAPFFFSLQPRFIQFASSGLWKATSQVHCWSYPEACVRPQAWPQPCVFGVASNGGKQCYICDRHHQAQTSWWCKGRFLCKVALLRLSPSTLQGPRCWGCCGGWALRTWWHWTSVLSSETALLPPLNFQLPETNCICFRYCAQISSCFCIQLRWLVTCYMYVMCSMYMHAFEVHVSSRIHSVAMFSLEIAGQRAIMLVVSYSFMLWTVKYSTSSWNVNSRC